jgi:hypothetical protein
VCSFGGLELGFFLIVKIPPGVILSAPVMIIGMPIIQKNNVVPTIGTKPSPENHVRMGKIHNTMPVIRSFISLSSFIQLFKIKTIV